MAKGTYLSIGLNGVDPAAYGGEVRTLTSCENDARDLAAIATAAGLTGTTLLTSEATSDAVLKRLYQASRALAPGDLFFLGYSGHGGQVRDTTGDEPDAVDETWCLHDRMLIDDELDSMWRQFRAGVRVFMVSDSCHSGSVAKLAKDVAFRASPDAPAAVRGRDAKVLPFDRSWKLYLAHQPQYDALQYVAGRAPAEGAGASVILISGCQDDQSSLAGDPNSLFTEVLKQVWDGGRFRGSYRAFHQAIAQRMPSMQTPNFFTAGPPDPRFEAQRPFEI